MKRKRIVILLSVSIIITLSLTSCFWLFRVTGGQYSGEWTVTADITLGASPNVWEGVSGGETSVQISQDLEHVTGSATMIIPAAPQRYPDSLIKLAMKTGLSILTSRAFPGMSKTVQPVVRNGNTIVADEDNGQVSVQFDVSFNGADSVNANLEVIFLENNYNAVITRQRNNENPNQVLFTAEIPELETVYSVNCTK